MTLFRSIVVGTDGSDTATTALRQAVDLARVLGAELQLVSAYEPVATQSSRRQPLNVPVDPQWDVHARGDVEKTLADAAALAERTGVDANVFARQGDPADAILDVAEEREADLIVIGNKGVTGARRFVLGSITNKISHHAPCSVLIIRTG